MRELLAPLQRLNKLMETQNEKIEEIRSVLTVNLKKAVDTNSEELRTQTGLLGDIKSLLAEQLIVNQEIADNTSKGGKTITFGRRRKLGTGLQVVMMAGAILAASAAFSLIPDVTNKQLMTAIAVAGVSLILSEVFVKIETAFDRSAARILAQKFTGVEQEGMKKRMRQTGSNISRLMVMMAVSTLFTALVFSVMPSITPKQLLTSLAVSIIMIPISVAVTGILYGLRRSGLEADKKSLSKLAVLPLMMAAIATGLVATAWIFKLMPDDIPQGPPPSWALSVGVLVASFSYALGMVLKATKKTGLKRTVLIATFALPALAIGIVAAAHIFNMLPDESSYKYIPLKWVANSAASILIMGITVGLLMTLSKLHKVKPKKQLRAVLGLALIGVAILAIAWIFTALPSTFIAPDYEWSKAAAIAIGIFAVPFMVVGFLASKMGPTALLYGALGVILIAATMFVVAWIFSAMPDLSSIAENFTKAIMTPVNAMIDALARFKNEIGVENLLPLAGGLFAIAGGWLALTAAMAGQAAGGLFSSVANLGSTIVDGLSAIFGGEKAKTPFDLLQLLSEKKDAIIALANPFQTLGNVFAKMALNMPGVIQGMGAILPLTQLRKMNRLQKSATAIDKIANAYQKISNASQLMNVDAINASSRMFEAIAKIAENDGEDAMTILAEKLMEAVEKLSATVKDLEDSTNGSASDIKDAVSGAIENFTSKILGSKKEGEGDDNGMLDMSVVVAAIQELEARFDRPIQIEDSAVF